MQILREIHSKTIVSLFTVPLKSKLPVASRFLRYENHVARDTNHVSREGGTLLLSGTVFTWNKIVVSQETRHHVILYIYHA